MVIENALDVSVNALADALTNCFEGYIMPAHFTGPLVAGMMRADSVDLAHSLIAKEDDQIIGVALVARRGKMCRIAAMAVAKSARRQGVGRAIMERAIEDARKRGEEEVFLEVIEQNPAAIELYKRVGFEIQHRLIGFEGILREDTEVLQPALLGPAAKPSARKPRIVKPRLRDCAFSDVAAAVRQRGFLASSWSMSPATVEQFAIPSRAVRCGDLFAVVGLSGEEVVGCRCVGFTKEPSRASVRTWVSAMAAEYPGKKLYMPAFFPEPEYADAFVDSGLTVGEISQFQMAMRL